MVFLRCFALVMAGLMTVASWATTVIPPEFSQLVNESDYIVRAVVKSVAAEFRNTPNGRAIFTRVEVEVKEIVAGTPPSPLVLEMLGGRIGDQEMRVEGAPRFSVGDEDILFVSGNGRTFHPLFALMHGRYPVMREAGTGREFIARENKIPLQDTAEVAQPMAAGAVAEMQRRVKSPAQALTPAEFVRQIRSAINPDYSRAKQR